MPITTGLQLFYPLASNTNELINSDNATNSGISFGTYSGVASADFTDPDYAFAANSVYNFSFGTGDFTFSVWLNPDVVSYGVSSQGTIFGTDYPNYEFTIYQGDIKLYLDYPNGITTNTGTAITTGAWQHVAVVRSGGVVTIYVDDLVPSQGNIGSPGGADITAASSPEFQIGKRVNSTSSNFYYDGKMSDVVLWDRGLSAGEITDIFNAGAGGFSGLITNNQSSINLFTSVVHNSSPNTANAINLYTSVVHDATPPTATGINLFSSVVHDIAQISGTLADITGTVGVSASFDGTVLGYSTSSVNLQWTWQSVPAGSSLTNQSYPLPDNKVNTYFDMTDNQGLWHFEGNADDTSGNGNNGTVNGATLVTGRVGNEAYSFDGSNDYITAPSALSLQITGNISIAAWIKADSYSQYESIVQYANPGESEANNHLYNVTWANSGGDIRLFWEYGGGNNVITDFNTNLNTGQWYHIVVVRDASETKAHLYVDGTLFGSETYSNNPTGGTTSQLWIGTDGGTSGYFDGTIDEVAIWSRDLSSLEVNNLYFLQSGSVATDLSGNVGLGETFTFVPDISGTFTTNLTATDGASSLNGNANAVISAAGPTPPGPTPVITGSNPTTKLVEAGNTGYIINTYSINLLSVQRSRTTEQVPFKLGTKGRQSLRLRTNTEFTGSS